MKKYSIEFQAIPLIFAIFVWLHAADFTWGEDRIISRKVSVDESHRHEDDQKVLGIKVDVHLVTVDVTVLGTNPPELHSKDFLIWDNDIAQQVSNFSRDRYPLAVALVIDRSQSIRNYLPLLQNAAISALSQLKPGDQVSLFAFDDNLIKLCDLTENRKLVAGLVGNLSIGRGTDIYDAIYYAARYLRSNTLLQRRAIILISDDCHTSVSGIGRESAQIEVMKAAASFYSLQTPGENNFTGKTVRDPNCQDSVAMVNQLADDTGGEVFDVNSAPSLSGALEKAISSLRLQYTLGFSPKDPVQPGSYHRLAIGLASSEQCSGCRLLARKGYYAPIASEIIAANKFQVSSGSQLSETNLSTIQRTMANAGTINQDLPDIPINASAVEQKAPDGSSQFKIDAHIDFSHVGFQTIGDLRSCKVYVGIFSNDAKGHPVASDWTILEGLLSEEAYARILKEGWSFSTTIPAVGRKAILRIVAYDRQTKSLGSKLIEIHFLSKENAH